MDLILNIDTATEHAIISISDKEKVLQFFKNDEQKDHATFLHTSVQQLIKDNHIHLQDLKAIAVVYGPGSYTGIRVGMASAKGLCYVLDKPLITVNTLMVMSNAALQNGVNKSYLLCPLLDARRMEAFFALYDNNLNTVLQPSITELSTDFLNDVLKNRQILFFGNAADKLKKICTHGNAHFINIPVTPEAMSDLAYKYLIINKFDSLKNSEPLYLKEFYQHKQIK